MPRARARRQLLAAFIGSPCRRRLPGAGAHRVSPGFGYPAHVRPRLVGERESLRHLLRVALARPWPDWLQCVADAGALLRGGIAYREVAHTRPVERYPGGRARAADAG